MGFLKNIGQKLKEFWKKLKKAAKIGILVSLAAVIILAITLSMINSKVTYVPIYNGTDQNEASQIVQYFDSVDQDYKLSPTGAVLVPKEEKPKLLLDLQSQGFSSKGLDYSYYADNALNMSVTDTDKEFFMQAQQEQLLSQLISDLNKVESATVKLVLPEESTFMLAPTGQTKSSASVVINVAQGETFTVADAEAVRQVLMTAVPQLSAEDVTILDSDGRLYTNEDMENTGTNVARQILLTSQMESLLKNRVKELLDPVLGENGYSTAINVVLNFDKKASQSVEFEAPNEGDDRGLIVSQKTLAERMAGGAAVGGEPGADPNGATVTYPWEDVTDENSMYIKDTNEYNAELNEMREQIESAQGKIEDMSISVIMNGGAEMDENIPLVKDIVAKAIGIKNQDNVAVYRMAFSGEQPATLEELMQQQMDQLAEMENQRTMQIWIIAGAVFLAIVIAIIIISSIIGSAERKRARELAEQAALEAQAAQQESMVDLAADEELSLEDLMSSTDDNISQIQDMVRKNPESIAQLLRNWLSNDYGR